MNSEHTIHVAFVGNPNCGKTTLFNALTGANLKVANWPGVTVEKKEGTAFYKGQKINLIDTPGIYSLTSYSIEEKVTRNCVMEDDIDVIVNVVDASSLERNLYLTLQLLELGKPVILAMNMMDIVKERGMEIDNHRLPEMLGNIPVVPVSARKRTGLNILLHAVKHHYEEDVQALVVKYSDEIENKITMLTEKLCEKYPELNKVIDELAEKYNVTNSAIAVAWILRHPARIQTIIGTTNKERIAQVSKASDIRLTREEWYALYMAAGNKLP